MNETETTVRTAAGELRGCVADGVRRFLSVPYAQPPVGERRFAPPVAVTPWQDIRDARQAGPNAPQGTMAIPKVDMVPIAGNGWVKGDDYLTLNVWSPEGARDLPVMVWVHGGGLVLGSKDAAVHDGSQLAAGGAVSVAINYRLGTEGFAPIPGTETNLGLRDVIAALTWVRDNIEAFGGDPGRVMLFGESGGAMIVSCLLASPLAEGLFHRAAVQSGHGSSVVSLDVGRRLVSRLATILKIEASREGFSSRTWDQILAAQAKISAPWAIDLRDEHGFDRGYGLGRFNPVIGDDVLPHEPLAALAAGQGREVDLLVGTSSEEANAFLRPVGLDRWLPGFAARWFLGRAIPQPREALEAYGAGRGVSQGEALARALTDLAFAWPAHQFAAAHQGLTHVYEFDWSSPTARLGTCHGLDLPFVFDTLDCVTGPRGVAGKEPPRELAQRMKRIWINFAGTGELPWPEFDGTKRLVHRFNADRTMHADIPPAARFSRL